LFITAGYDVGDDDDDKVDDVLITDWVMNVDG